MQMVKRIVGGFFLTLILLWLFAPKQELYYLLEQSLKEKNIIISNEKFTDTWFGLKINNADVYLSGAKIAKVEELKFNFFFFYNKLSISNVTIDKSLENIAPKSVDNLTATYSVLSPLKIKLEGDGSVGSLDGEISLIERKVEILFPTPKEIQSIKKFLKKDATKGWYYETAY